HIYQKAGTYTVSLTVTDSAGNVSIAKGQVTISADTRRKVYVDNVAGSDANSGATPNFAVATAARAAQLMGDNTELLFHNGQQFNVADTIALNYKNIVIGTYGSGAMARLVKVVGNGASIFNIGNSSDGVLAEGIEFDSMWDINTYGDAKVNVRAFFVAGKNFAVRDSRFLNLDDGVNTAGYPTGVLVQDNYFGPQIRGCCIWGEGYDHVYIGNTMTNSTQEHLIRTSGIGVTRLLVEDNNMSRPDNSKGSLELRTASWFYVSGNRIDGGTLRIGLPNGADSQFTGWGVVENNETYRFFVNFRPGVQHVAFRDNVIHYDNGAAILLETLYSVPRQTADIRIDHNTAISNGAQGKFLKLDGPATDISVTNNLFVGPNLQWVGESTGAMYVVGKDLSSFSAISGNIWPQMPAGSNQTGDNYLLPVTGDIVHGYQTAAQWASHSQVTNEQYASPTVGGNVYSMTLNGITAGALPGIFDTNTYKLAA
ncbi:MAG: domain containing protein, partial [Phycisphaerales bacterium]|nr:domain containing protein [Phycisphaerales bacterium]